MLIQFDHHFCSIFISFLIFPTPPWSSVMKLLYTTNLLFSDLLLKILVIGDSGVCGLVKIYFILKWFFFLIYNHDINWIQVGKSCMLLRFAVSYFIYFLTLFLSRWSKIFNLRINWMEELIDWLIDFMIFMIWKEKKEFYWSML